jgi:hypothetical protein
VSDEELTIVCFKGHKKLSSVRQMSVFRLTINHPTAILNFCYRLFIKKTELIDQIKPYTITLSNAPKLESEDSDNIQPLTEHSKG